MKDISENTNIVEIQNEYKRIDSHWLKLHYRTFIGLVLFSFVVECVLCTAFFSAGYVEIPLTKYILKYILSPLIVNTGLILIGFWAMYSPRLQQNAKAYCISLLIVGVCFVIFTVHSIFSSLYLIFAVPILLTVIYSNYTLTTVTAFLSILAKTISETVVTWDPDKLHPFDSAVGRINFAISLCILCALYAVCVIVIRFIKDKNSAIIQKEIERCQIQRKLITDELTQTYNRTALRKAFEEMEGDLSENTYIFVMIDLDNFKTLNDTMGHNNGDECLKEFGRILRENCSDNSLPVRFGGDEFCILFKNRPIEEVMETCIQIQDDLNESPVNHPTIPVTASVGIAYYKKGMTASQLLKNTDDALYRSKTLKDSICIFDDAAETMGDAPHFGKTLTISP